MFDLIKASETAYYIDCPVRMGIVKINENEVIAIDTGLDKNTGRKLLQIIEKQGWTLKAIYNTHSHADHIGGNAYIHAQTHCQIFAPKAEAACIRETSLEPAFLNGAYPPKYLRNKFFMAEPSHAIEFEDDNLLAGLSIIPLAGHSFNMYGFKTCDDVIFLGDALASVESIEKYKIVYAYDIAKYIETLEMLKNIKAKLFIPSHVVPSDDISFLLQYNIDKVLEIGENLIDICTEAKSFDYILQAVFNRYSLTMDQSQHALAGSCIRSYLAWLKDTNKLDIYCEDNILYWKSI